MSEVRKCSACQTEKEASAFAKDHAICKACDRERKLQTRYGISDDTYEILWRHQRGRCRICETKSDKLVIDHCHKTKKVRGLLCHECNMGLGKLKDDIGLLCSAIEYLNSTRGSSKDAEDTDGTV